MNKINRTLLIFAGVVLLSAGAMAQNNMQRQIDSLRRVIPTQHGVEKVDSYRILASYLFDAATKEELIAFFNELETVILQEQANDKDKSRAQDYTLRYASTKLNRGYIMFNYGDFDGAATQARNVMEYSRENELWVQYYKDYRLLLDALTASMKYETLKQEAQKLYQEAKERNSPEGMVTAIASLADAYMKQFRFAEAERYYKECIALSAKANFVNVCYVVTDVYLCFSEVLTLQEKYAEALQALKETEITVQRLEEVEAAKGRVTLNKRIALYIFYADYYLKIKDYPNAERYCNLAEESVRLIEAEESVDDAKLFALRAQIVEARGQYAEALKLADKSSDLLLAMGSAPLDLNGIMTLKARLLIRLGRDEEGIALYDSIQKRTTDILNTEFNANIDELRTQYEVDKLEAENKIISIEKQRHLNNFLFALGVCILLIIVLGIWIRYSRVLICKNRELVRKNQEWAGVENMKNTEDEEDTEEKHPYLADDADDIVMNEIRKILEGGAYKDGQLTLDTLAKQLGYHANYISFIINRGTGKNFKTCINEYRIKEVIRIFSDKERFNTVSIDTVAFEAGFNDRSHFYRVFRKMTGLSPGDFIKNAQKEL